MPLIVLRIIQNVSIHLNKQKKLQVTLFGQSDSGCGLQTGFSVN